MKLLVGSCFSELPKKITRLFQQLEGDIEIFTVESVDEILKELAKDPFDALIVDYALQDIDIWRLSPLIHSSQFVSTDFPIYLIEEFCETQIPAILAQAYRFKVVELHELLTTLHQLIPFEMFKPSCLIIEDEVDAADIAMHALKDLYRMEWKQEC